MAKNNYAVIGNPIQHSKSPQIHSAFAKQEGVEIHYQRILAEPSTFKSIINQFIEADGVGLNVTVPFKIKAYETCKQLDVFANAAKAVNTISFSSEGIWNGYNTDGIGLITDLKNNKQIRISNKRILILGAGGATRGIVLPLLQEKPSSITIANRTIPKATQLANDFATYGDIEGCGFDNLDNDNFDIVINATSASLSNELPPVPNQIVTANSICYDLAYSDEPTPFLLWAQSQGVTYCFDGIGMLIEQAAESYFIWRGYRPITSSVFTLLRPK